MTKRFTAADQIIHLFSDDPCNFDYFPSGEDGEGEYWSFWRGWTPNIRGFFKNGVKDGEWCEYDNSGVIMRRYFCKDHKDYTIQDARQKFPQGPWLNHEFLF